MSEKLSFAEHLNQAEHELLLPKGEAVEANQPRAEVESTTTPEKPQALAVAEAAAAVNEAEPVSGQTEALKQLTATENEPEATTNITTPEMKQLARNTGLKRVQDHEKLPERALSKLIHQPVVRVASEAAGKTVSRPSGLLGGGLVAFLGSGSYLVLAKYLGFTYNYSISLMLLAGGFAIGLALELVVHLLTASRRHAD